MDAACAARAATRLVRDVARIARPTGKATRIGLMVATIEKLGIMPTPIDVKRLRADVPLFDALVQATRLGMKNPGLSALASATLYAVMAYAKVDDAKVANVMATQIFVIAAA